MSLKSITMTGIIRILIFVLPYMFLHLFLPLILFLFAGCADREGQDGGQPNIILVLADDLGIETLGCYGGTSYETPNLDRMATEGMRFTHAYSQPLCTPTRIQLMTGKYNHRNWLYFGVLDPRERTFGHLMSNAGYRTCIAGKWQLYSYDPPDYPGAEKRRGTGTLPVESGFDEYSLFHSLHTEEKGSRYADPTFLRNGELFRNVEGAYGEDLNVSFIVDFLERHRDEPVFIYYPMALPHGPFVPTPLSEDWNDPEKRLEANPKYFPDMVRYMDILAGRLIGKVEELELEKNTLILFYSDNGTPREITSYMGDIPVPGGKGMTTQTGIRVPLIACWPGRIKPAVVDDLVDASDFLPTLAELVGAEIPGDWSTDGISFAPRLLGRDGKKREHAFFWYDPRPGWDKDKFSRHIFALDHDFKLFEDGRMFDIGGLTPAETELDTASLSPAALAAREKLEKVIAGIMKPPMSTAARSDPEEYAK
jgi:arylsulfatase A-like enzyme